MSDMKRQHLISLIFLAAMALWIGGSAAVYSFTGLGGSIPPSIVVERAEPVVEFAPDENYADRYLDWGSSPRLRSPATSRGGSEPTPIIVGKAPPPPQVRGRPTC